MLSYARGLDAPLIDDSIYDVFARTAETYPDRDALIVSHQQICWTFQELRKRAEAVSAGLSRLSLKRNDRIGVWSANYAEWILVQLACARLGLVLVNVNPAYRAYELSYVLCKSRIRALFLWENDDVADYRSILDEAKAGQSLPLEQVVYFNSPEWASLPDKGPLPSRDLIQADDVANIQYTSGTTGRPKGVLLTHCNLLNNARVVADGMNLSFHDRICAPVPLYHCFGCVGGILASFVTGAALLLPAPRFHAEATLACIQEAKATAIYGVPTMFIAELEHPAFAQFDLSSLRTGVMAGAPCPIEVMKRVIHHMHCPEMTIMYGQTESSPVITMSHVHDPVEIRVGTVGKACANTEVKITDPASGETLPLAQEGELCTRGYLVMKGYDEEPEATARAIDADGWLHTGDLAVMRPDEYVRVTGRAKDLIIRGGENIYPREIEEFLYTHPKIADVQVFGLPDRKLGETVAAWVRLRPGQQATSEELQQYCKSRIAHFKIPQHIRFIEQFPMTVTGKIQKFKMREQEIEALNLQAADTIETA